MVSLTRMLRMDLDFHKAQKASQGLEKPCAMNSRGLDAVRNAVDAFNNPVPNNPLIVRSD